MEKEPAGPRMPRRAFISRTAALGLTLPGVAGVLAACGDAGSKSASTGAGGGDARKGGTVGNFFDSLADEWFVDEAMGAEQVAKAFGLESQNFTFGADPSKQIQHFQNAVTRQVNMWGVYSPLGAGVKNMVQSAKRAKAFCCAEFDLQPWSHPTQLGPELGLFWMPDNVEGAYQAGKRVLEEIGGKGNVVVVVAYPGGQNNESIDIGYKRALAEFPDVKVLARGVGKFQREPAQKLMADWLAQFSKIDAVLSFTDTMSFGIQAAMKQAGRTNIPIASVNGQLPGLEAVKRGEIAVTVFNDPRYFGAFRTVRLYDLVNGYKPSVPELMLQLGATLVDKSNVDEYIDYMRADTLPHDFERMSRVAHPEDWELQTEVSPIQPVEFWKDHNLGTKESAGWITPELRASLDKGEFEDVAKLYTDHVGTRRVGAS